MNISKHKKLKFCVLKFNNKWIIHAHICKWCQIGEIKICRIALQDVKNNQQNIRTSITTAKKTPSKMDSIRHADKTLKVKI